MTVELLEDKKRWDQFVETSPQGSLFHKWDFLKTVERNSKFEFLPFCVYSGEQLRCIFPFFMGWDHGLKVMCSPPVNTQIPYLGPVFDPGTQTRRAVGKEKIFNQVTTEVCGEIDKIAPNLVSITTVPNFLDVRFFIWKKYEEYARMTYAIDLERSLDEIWASFSRRCRQKIKQLSAYSPEIQQTNDVSALLDIWRPRFSELGMKVPLLSDSYLKELVGAFPQDMTVYNLTIDGRVAAAIACCVMQKGRYGLWIGGTSARKDLGVNEYLDWEVAKRAKSEGFKKLDLGPSDAGPSQYKSKFDPVLEPYWTLKKTDTLHKIYFAGKKLRGLRSQSQVLARYASVSAARR